MIAATPGQYAQPLYTPPPANGLLKLFVAGGVARPVWEPQPGPQAKFKSSDAYEVLYGGAAGGGKTWALGHDGLEYAVQGGRSLFLRRTFPELQEVIDLLLPTIRAHGGEWKEQKKRAEFPNGGVFQFGYCGTYREVLQYQGQQFGWIGFDELGLIPEERIWTYLISRNRSSSARLPRKMRASANPGGVGHHWIKRRFITPCKADGTPYRHTLADGSTVSRAFIQSFLADNKKLVEADPGYASRLEMLPELERAWLKDGNWSAGAGAALSELADLHVIDPFDVPKHWRWFGAFDWGYNHPFSFGFFTVNEDGQTFLVESVHGRRLKPNEIAHRIREVWARLGSFEFDYIVAGHDCWADHKARGENIPTIAEQFYELGLGLDKANISRVAGVQNLRRYLTWKDAEGKEHDPAFRMFRTSSNAQVFECLASRVTDPKHLEDVLKVDADEHGNGGDDDYDMVRYGLASRPITASPVAAPSPITSPFQDRWAHEELDEEGGSFSQFGGSW